MLLFVTHDDRTFVTRFRREAGMLELKTVSWSDGLGALQNWRTASEVSLRYDHFLGDVRICLESADFTTTWTWVPVLEFAAGLAHLLQHLHSGGEETFEFTESEATLTFRRSGDVVEVTASYADGFALVDYVELRAAARGFLGDVRHELQGRHPGLTFNTAFSRLASPPEF